MLIGNGFYLHLGICEVHFDWGQQNRFDAMKITFDVRKFMFKLISID